MTKLYICSKHKECGSDNCHHDYPHECGNQCQESVCKHSKLVCKCLSISAKKERKRKDVEFLLQDLIEFEKEHKIPKDFMNNSLYHEQLKYAIKYLREAR